MRSNSAQGLIDRIRDWLAAAIGRAPKPVPVPVRVRTDERPYPTRRDALR